MIRRPAVVEDPNLTHECSKCGKFKPRTREYFHTRGHGASILVNICKVCQSERDSAVKARRRAEQKSALVLVNPRPVVFDDLGTQASVGWYGEVEYFPITPLLALTRYATEHGLLEAIRNDALMSAVPRLFVTLASDGKRYPVWHLPWSHFSAFCLKFGNEQTKPQQDRAQRVLEAAFGHTAASNRAAAIEPIVTPQQREPDAIEQIRNGLITLFAPTLEQMFTTALDCVIEQRLGLMPQQVAQTHETLQGATVIEREVERIIHDEWVAVGQVYLAVEPNKGLMSVGSVKGTKTPHQRMLDSDYNGDKGGDGAWRVVWSARVDSLDSKTGAEVALIKCVARAGVEQITKSGTFRYDARMEADFRQLPNKLRIATLSQWTSKLFTPLMFV